MILKKPPPKFSWYHWGNVWFDCLPITQGVWNKYDGSSKCELETLNLAPRGDELQAASPPLQRKTWSKYLRFIIVSSFTK